MECGRVTAVETRNEIELRWGAVNAGLKAAIDEGPDLGKL